MSGRAPRRRTVQSVELPVLGVTTEFSSEAPEVLAAVQEAYGAWRGVPDPGPVPAARVRIHPQETVRTSALSLSCRLLDHARLLVLAPGSFGIADTRRSASVAFVSPGLMADRGALTEGMLDPLTLFLLGALDREPVHAACVVRDGVAVLLAGGSGAGKSTLTYVAQRHGYSVLADDAVYVQRRGRFRVWGRAARISLPPEARDMFPELRGEPCRRMANGKEKIALALGDATRCRYADRTALCVLDRRPRRQAKLARASVAWAVGRIAEGMEPGFDLFAATIGERVARLGERGCWRLSLGGAPSEAMPLLDRVVAEVSRRQ